MSCPASACDLRQPLKQEVDAFHANVTGNPMGDANNDDLRVSFDSRLKLKFLGSQVTTDAGRRRVRNFNIRVRPRKQEQICFTSTNTWR